MLVASDSFAAAVGRWMVSIVGFDEAVVGQSVLLAGVEKIRESCEEVGLILQQVDDLHGGAGLVVVKELAGVAGAKQASVDGLEGLALVEEVHAHLAEGRTVVGEGTVAYRGTRDGGEPAIENGILRGERAEDGQFVRREVVENLLRVGHVLLLIEVAGDEALHGGSQRRPVLGAVEDLQVDGGKMMVGIGVKLALVRGKWLDRDVCAGRVGIGLRAGKAVDVGICGFERPEHVIEGAVLHHQDDDVLETLNSRQSSV